MFRLATVLLLAYWAALAGGTHWPNYGSGPARYNDKLAHFVGYAGLAFLLSFVWTTRRRWQWRGMWLVLATTTTYAMLDELSQIPIPGRSGEFRDWLADLLGSTVGILAFSVIVGLARAWWGTDSSRQSTELE